MNINPLLATDFYKTDHRRQYPEGTTEIYSNFTPRYVKQSHNLLPDFDNQVVVFGIRAMLDYLILALWEMYFFCCDKEEVIGYYKDLIEKSLNIENFDASHLEELYDLGYLPIEIKALPEGSRCPIGVPLLTIRNTLPEFFWLTNYLETMISSFLWKPITSATTAFEFRCSLTNYADRTGVDREFVRFQAHDFSFRGMSGIEDAMMSGAGHLTSFYGTDCIPAIEFLNHVYQGNKVPIVGCSIPATEHSVMCCEGSQYGEFMTIHRLLEETYPNGMISIVADSYNFWDTLQFIGTEMHDLIMKRDGKVVIRPDSGDPLAIICGNPEYQDFTMQGKGALQCLWNYFGGTINEKGYKVLDPHIGLIYGDSITVSVADRILAQMERMGFASSNIVFGVGSYTYQYVTRDNFGFAMKATSAVIDGERRAIFKDPVTAKGSKTSAKGLLKVDYDLETTRFYLTENVSEEEEKTGALETVFLNGDMRSECTLETIRSNLDLEFSLL
jgi:nicotinamide phosphoribosyltransferase